MTKTTVYLSDDTKQRLSREAQRRGVSEALLIREAIETLLDEGRPRPQVPLFRSGLAGVAADADAELDRLGFGT
jgi:predicted transcriptional regulator